MSRKTPFASLNNLLQLDNYVWLGAGIMAFCAIVAAVACLGVMRGREKSTNQPIFRASYDNGEDEYDYRPELEYEDDDDADEDDTVYQHGPFDNGTYPDDDPHFVVDNPQPHHGTNKR